jgi:hypothetical protein
MPTPSTKPRTAAWLSQTSTDVYIKNPQNTVNPSIASRTYFRNAPDTQRRIVDIDPERNRVVELSSSPLVVKTWSASFVAS